MPAPTRTRATQAEYFALDDASARRRELIDGRIIALPAETLAHGLVSANLTAALGVRLKGRRCRSFGGGWRVAVEGTGDLVFADAVVACPPYDLDARAIATPRLVAEVVSPASHGHDLGVKAPLYRSIGSLTDLLLVELRARRVVHHRRVGGGWSERGVTEGAVSLASLEIELPLDEIYEGALDAAR